MFLLCNKFRKPGKASWRLPSACHRRLQLRTPIWQTSKAPGWPPDPRRSVLKKYLKPHCCLLCRHDNRATSSDEHSAQLRRWSCMETAPTATSSPVCSRRGMARSVQQRGRRQRQRQRRRRRRRRWGDMAGIKSWPWRRRDNDSSIRFR